MGPCWRAAFNLLPLRGKKRRLAKLLAVLLLSGALSLLVLRGGCVPGSGKCGEGEGEGEGVGEEVLERVRAEFEAARDYVSSLCKPHFDIRRSTAHSIGVYVE